jgi:hypothetical protein
MGEASSTRRPESSGHWSPQKHAAQIFEAHSFPWFPHVDPHCERDRVHFIFQTARPLLNSIFSPRLRFAAPYVLLRCAVFRSPTRSAASSSSLAPVPVFSSATRISNGANALPRALPVFQPHPCLAARRTLGSVFTIERHVRAGLHSMSRSYS